MYFWIVTALLTLVVLATLARAMLRGSVGDRPPAAYDLDVYRDQLREVDRDLARGVVSEADADRVRTEVSRRILAADAALQKQEQKLDGSGGYVTLGLTIGAIVVGSYVIYNELGAPGYGDLALADRIEAAQILREERPSQQAAEASLDQRPPPTDVDPDYVALVEQLRQAVTTRPGDIQGHELLSRAEGRLGNFARAHAAKAQVISLKGADATASDFSEYADLMILAAGGYVSPEAEGVLERALSMDPTDGPSRYYYGLMNAQTGRPDTALRIWDQLLREGPADAPWIGPVSSQIEDIAIRAGVNYALPAIGTGRGPNADQIEAAENLSPAERMEMIQGMVSGLSDRLATEGGPVEDWAQLISALGVLGQMEQARAILINARDVFGDDPRAGDILSEVADRVGLE
ncbi:c-type cytochrome biogenesis protein CcmI [Tateyamaria omphalii]|uniref:C-type cytochrome biogenesis protein CcmI n=1 Tax=Tateyamaria omphalii TaxID=299262 RepID=A0A1P8MRD2_9RHOB|nr:c-type cytochrome biogenesis protein CcmI [Tateyamaria omphalii]APX10605.1 c-type cytochrome biogenesis protein CcmI [Tateyamaria omphalii]